MEIKSVSHGRAYHSFGGGRHGPSGLFARKRLLECEAEAVIPQLRTLYGPDGWQAYPFLAHTCVRADGHEIKLWKVYRRKLPIFVDSLQTRCRPVLLQSRFVMNTIALLRETRTPTDDEIRAFSQEICAAVPLRTDSRAGIRSYLNSRKA